MRALEDLGGRVAVVTGAGRGLGLAYARHLAARGAAVVMNDVGIDPEGSRNDGLVLADAVAEVTARGGIAVGSDVDIATSEGGRALVAQAHREFGRIDVLIHNAGIGGGGPFATLSEEVFDRVLRVHLWGAFYTAQPAWQSMLGQKFGRIILISSSGVLGIPNAVPYCSAKAAILGFARALAAEAAALPGDADIKVNVLIPTADTRRGGPARDVFGALGAPSLVAPVAGYLASPECGLNGEIIHAGASHVARLFLGLTHGWAKSTTDLTHRDVSEHLDDVTQTIEFTVPRSPLEVTQYVAARVLGDAAEAERRLEGWKRTLGASPTSVGTRSQ